MIPRRIGKPVPPITIDELRQHLRIDFQAAVDSPQDSPPVFPENDLLERILGAAVAYAENYTGLAISLQRFQIDMPSFPGSWPYRIGPGIAGDWHIPITSPAWTDPNRYGLGYRCDFIQIENPPLLGIDSITYTDADGETQNLDASAWVVDEYAASTPRIYPLAGTNWPETKGGSPIVLRYRCGFESALDSPTDSGVDSPYSDDPSLPDDLRAAILWTAGNLYENRSDIIAEVRVTPALLPWGVREMLQPYRLSIGL